jgi:predicted nuclease of restriction endonuclease-like RecB superfamily
MLTADLIRATVRKGEIKAQFVDTGDDATLERATALCALWSGAVGKQRGELDEALDDLASEDPRAMLVRGLAKLLDDRSEWGTSAPLDPVDLRQRVFEAAFARHPIGSGRSANHPDTRSAAIGAVAEALGVAPETVEEGLYADLRDEQRLEKYDPIEPEELLHRYNLGLAQAILIRAREMRVELRVDRPARLRWLFRQLKFCQLMHRTEALEGGRWRITLDGPASILGGGQRYGVQMALFLPSVVHTNDWLIEADIVWPHHGDVVFKLSPRDGLRASVRETGTWISAEEKQLVERINAGSSTWRAESCAEVLPLAGQDVLVPDVVLRCSKTQRVAYVDIVGYWRRDWLMRRAKLLEAHAPPNLIVCVSRKLRVDRETLEIPGWVDFAEVIPMAKVLARAEIVGVAPEAPSVSKG